MVAKNTYRKSSFTLIEMLLVMVVIAIMAGMLFKIMTYTNRQTMKASTIAKLEALAMGLNEYRAEYGMYPGVTSVLYEFESTNAQTPAFNAYLDTYTNYPTDGGYESPNRLFHYGLVAHLWPRRSEDEDGCVVNNSDTNFPYVGNVIRTNCVNMYWWPDNARDEAVKARWMPFFTNVVNLVGGMTPKQGESGARDGQPTTGFPAPFRNRYYTIHDGWDNEIHYECIPPYQTYKLWSDGATSSTNDDIHRHSWDN